MLSIINVTLPPKKTAEHHTTHLAFPDLVDTHAEEYEIREQ